MSNASRACAAEHQVERLLLELVHRVHHAGLVDVAAERVELLEQRRLPGRVLDRSGCPRGSTSHFGERMRVRVVSRRGSWCSRSTSNGLYGPPR